jgi:hypothetical protein
MKPISKKAFDYGERFQTIETDSNYFIDTKTGSDADGNYTLSVVVSKKILDTILEVKKEDPTLNITKTMLQTIIVQLVSILFRECKTSTALFKASHDLHGNIFTALELLLEEIDGFKEKAESEKEEMH